MMRFGLRTLLIVVALIGGPLARLGYLKQMARFHHRAVEALIPTLCGSDRLTPDEARYQISFMAWNASRITSKMIGQPYVVGIGSTEYIDLASDAGRGHLILDAATLTEWNKRSHTRSLPIALTELSLIRGKRSMGMLSVSFSNQKR